jgi:hypothetical protein
MKDADSMNPRCRDIIADAFRATNEATAICSILFKESDNELPLKSAMESYFQTHLEHLERIRNRCLELDHSDENTRPEMMFHKLRIDKLVGAPLDRSHETNILQSRIYQQRSDEIRRESDFAEKLISSILCDLEIEAIPIVVFTTQAQYLNLNTHFVITIPFSHFRSYDRWWILGHEIGHHYYRTHHDFDIDDLFKHLVECIPEDVWSENKEKIEQLIYIWIRNWLPELIADYIALSLFGFYYIIEVRHIESIEFGMAGVSHPPLSFRHSFLYNIMAQNDINLALIEEFREEEQSNRFNPILNSLLSNEISTFLANWVLNQYSEIEFRWNEIETLPKNSRVSSLFASICLESYKRDVSEEFDLLKKRLMDA